MIRRALTCMCVAASAVAFTLVVAPPVSGEPIPGTTIDPDELRNRMDRCIEYAVPESELLIGWVNFWSGEVRNWRCSSLRHMLFDDELRNPPVRHDPYVNIPDFVRCAEKAVRGFPRPASKAGYTNYIYQYSGVTSGRTYMTVNDVTGDVATIYTDPLSNDWTTCATAL